MRIRLLLILFVLIPLVCFAGEKIDYKKFHNEISDCYYNGKSYQGKILTKEEFETLHSLNWLKKEKEDADKGKIKEGRTVEEIDGQIKKIEDKGTKIDYKDYKNND